MPLRKVWRGTAKTLACVTPSGSTSRLLAPTAERLTAPAILGQRLGFAPITVEHTPERPAALTTYNALALIAKDNSQLTVTQRRSIAPRNVRKLLALDFVPLPSRVPVYNLSTTDGTFFVNGVLVHNCDTIRYLCASVEKLSTEDPMTSQNGRASEPPRKSILVDARTVGGRRIGA
jgi:hypothetical protein